MTKAIQPEIRKVAEAEVNDMLKLTIEAYEEYRNDSPDGFWEGYLVNLTEAITQATEAKRIAAFLGPQMVGSVLLCRRSMGGELPEIRLLAVSPAHRERGIARRLMNECEARLKASGAQSVVLHTTRLMEIARQMYERAGYARAEEYDFSPVPGFVVWGYIKQLVQEENDPSLK